MLKSFYLVNSSDAPITTELQKFNNEYFNTKIKYDFSYLEKWIEFIENSRLKTILSFFKGKEHRAS